MSQEVAHGGRPGLRPEGPLTEVNLPRRPLLGVSP